MMAEDILRWTLPPAGKCWRVEVGFGLGLESKCMSKDDAMKIGNRINTGGMRVFLIGPKGKSHEVR